MIPMSAEERRELVNRPFAPVRVIPAMAHAGVFVDHRDMLSQNRFSHQPKEQFSVDADDVMDFLI